MVYPWATDGHGLAPALNDAVFLGEVLQHWPPGLMRGSTS